MTTTPKYLVLGVTHIDLAWMKDRHEMAEMLDIFIIRLLDALETHPSFKYMLEQAFHYRELLKRRPDLVQRLKQFVQAGRLEFVGGMASTMETNVPNGECFVRNQLIGMNWVRDHFGVEIQTGWLLDTFGLHAQIPQILQQFGILSLIASRFGGMQNEDVFRSRGLDGSEILIVGQDFFAPYIQPGHLFSGYIMEWSDTDRVFKAACEAKGDGPFILWIGVENEMLLSLRAISLEELGNIREPGKWVFATPRECFDALGGTGKTWPVENGDLNPEFTGTFSQRIAIKMMNRKVENLLLDAEKWASLVGLKGWEKEIEELWWQMAFNQYHDVFTGSHPSKVFHEVMASYNTVETTASLLLGRLFRTQIRAAVPKEARRTIVAFNGLPWTRSDLIALPLTDEISNIQFIRCGNRESPFEIFEGQVFFLAEIPAVGFQTFEATLRPALSPPSTGNQPQKVNQAVIENEYIRFECDTTIGIRQLVWKETGESLLKDVGDFLIIQQDHGHFQIEEPIGAEVPASSGRWEVYLYEPSQIGQRLILTGKFPMLSWAGEGNFLEWKAEFTLVKGKPRLGLRLEIHWMGEGSRVRLKLPTTLDTSVGIYEIPFGVVRRKPYGVRVTSRGEWPAHRFVALEDGRHGLALVNTGTAGVEVNGGCIWTTLLRAPITNYGKMVPDDTSSQHGTHHFDFSIVPYSGTWSDTDVLRMAQETNSPILSVIEASVLVEPAGGSFITLYPDTVILSAVKLPEDGADELVVRVYETAGKQCTAQLSIMDADQAWVSDLKELKQDPVECPDGLIQLDIKPFEIKTFRIHRMNKSI